MVRDLAEGGFINTQRGAGGGFTLARPPQAITLGEVVRALEDRHALVECFRDDGGNCVLLPRCRLRARLAAAREAFMRELDATTLAECAYPARSTHEPDAGCRMTVQNRLNSKTAPSRSMHRSLPRGSASRCRCSEKQMRAGKITSQSERGVDDDIGRYRLTFFSEHRRFRVVVDEGGAILQRSTLNFGDSPLPKSLRKPGG